MASFRLKIHKITGKPELTVGIYIPIVDDATHHYGLAEHWDLMGEFSAWLSDSSRTDYGGDGGVDATKTTTVYVEGNRLLPPRVGVRIGENAKIKASLSVENYFDFDGQYVYSIVVI